MSTLKEISEGKITITLKPRESFLLSFFRDFTTFSMLAFCIYISQGSTWWTFLTGLIFLGLLFIKMGNAIKKHTTVFNDIESAKKYLDSVDLGD